MPNILTPKILIISSKFDFSSDHICLRLKESGAIYFRLNRDQLEDYEISFDPKTVITTLKSSIVVVHILPDVLKSVYYRAPTFLREIFNQEMSSFDQLKRSQWAAFIRSLVLYDKAFWVNDPVKTYRAEMKPLQLTLANKLGFNIPNTVISNSNSLSTFDQLFSANMAIKTIDTALVSNTENDGFVYTNFLGKTDIEKYNNRGIPFIAQNALVPKLDIRVTIIGKQIFPISISSPNGIDGDWRLIKHDIIYKPYELPQSVSDLCFKLMYELELNFGGIDLVYSNGEYFFIEINPTGEWDWLENLTQLGMDKAIANLLIAAQ